MTDKPDLPWDDSIAPPWRTVAVGEGWWPIVAELDRELREVAPDYRVLQVKEKFGGLRYYTVFPAGNYTELKDRVQSIMRAAEEKATRTCEECGQPGALRSGRWHRTLCDLDEVKYQERYAEMMGEDEV